MNKYRSRIYGKYVSKFKDGSTIFNEKESLLWRKGYKWWFGDWLPLNKDAKILDVACGGGMLLHYFKDLGYTNICGVDISPEQVALSKKVIENVTIGDVLVYLEAYRSEYDVIIGLDIIEHFQKDEILRFLDLCHQALRRGGRLILQTPNAESPLSTSIRYGDFSHEICFNPNSLLRLMHMCGFEQVEAREQGPVPWGYSLISTIRYTIWQSIRIVLKVWNIAETGGCGSGVFTRVFLASGLKA